MKINTRKTADKIENTYEVYEMTTNLGLIVALSPIGASIQKLLSRQSQVRSFP